MAGDQQLMEVLDIEPSIQGALEFRNLELAVENASHEQLKELCLLMGRQALIVLPAANRWAIKEACRSMNDWREVAMELREQGLGSPAL